MRVICVSDLGFAASAWLARPSLASVLFGDVTSRRLGNLWLISILAAAIWGLSTSSAQAWVYPQESVIHRPCPYVGVCINDGYSYSYRCPSGTRWSEGHGGYPSLFGPRDDIWCLEPEARYKTVRSKRRVRVRKWSHGRLQTRVIWKTYTHRVLYTAWV